MASESFLSRWSQRKLEPQEESALVEAPTASVETNAEHTEDVELTEAHIGSAEETTQDAKAPSIAALLASEATQQVKKAALRKLFLSGEFSEVDRLNDYDHDYTAVKSLGAEVAQGLRDWMNKADEGLQTADTDEKLDGESGHIDAMPSESEQTAAVEPTQNSDSDATTHEVKQETKHETKITT
ncbi:DUF3306 domain-containing protein [Vibrio furnissii]|uniref:DUF3306 domain-containing protein n=1 Tax=Vibrio furnissii TaxID=29494 RepID=UPI00117CBA2F|nr:DUF3306 domain-containing protein [Vibrio furnissii]TRN26362.1 DUF3306 domain-containing protein [Vibrio furnissii]